MLRVCQRRLTISRLNAPVANLPYTHIPTPLYHRRGHRMAQRESFAAYYFDKEDDGVFSLCSTEDGLGVSEIAKAYGGGGHSHAASFHMPRDHELGKS